MQVHSKFFPPCLILRKSDYRRTQLPTAGLRGTRKTPPWTQQRTHDVTFVLDDVVNEYFGIQYSHRAIQFFCGEKKETSSPWRDNDLYALEI
ncbi:hypothetical protein TNCT_59461 [Trichonephila clavata]|uniref:Uncharacterized protein n=1 Tax=Trichonephila clavata TaxID=2740835 RepID=A0A8X6FLG5_TRICU|nr:hypothetical protein TNCT_59461 [Trichonephila clavata]